VDTQKFFNIFNRLKKSDFLKNRISQCSQKRLKDLCVPYIQIGKLMDVPYLIDTNSHANGVVVQAGQWILCVPTLEHFN